MQYIEKYKEAVQRTNALGLFEKKDLLPLSPQLNRSQINNIIGISLEIFRKSNITTSEILIQNCAGTHAFLAYCLRHNGIKCEVTTGQITINKKKWLHNVSIESLTNEIESPNFDKPINFHAWITLEDGTIFDWTIRADQSYKQGLIVPIENCCICIPANEFDPDHYYEPMLVGRKYLYRIGAIQKSVAS